MLANRRSLATCLEAYGINCVSYDKVLGDDWDLADDLVWTALLAKIRQGLYKFVFSSLPCKSAAISRHRPDRGPGPGPLRATDKRGLWGLPNLQPADKELVRLGNLHVTRTGIACREVMAAGGWGFGVEQPAPVDGLPSLLHLEPLQLEDLGAVDVIFHQCPFGADSVKPTCIRYVGGSFDQLAQHQCTHPKVTWTDERTGESYEAPHQRLAGRKLPNGKWATESAQHYSDLLNETLASCIAAGVWGRKGDPASADSFRSS